MKAHWFALAAVGFVSSDALACGCFAPPVPEASDGFAVNQRAEQIIFEVEPGRISAHVRILYQGDPEQFAWLLPVPSVPDLELSETVLFSFIDSETAPLLRYSTRDVCPEQQYVCNTHRSCDAFGYADAGAYDVGDDDASGDDDVADDDAPTLEPPVTVLASERIGAYDTITFAADEATLAIDWLNDNGFIVNETMSPYMQPYLDAGMVFVASKLVPGAGVDEIRPLRISYEADLPAIPLRLTAVAAEPHMMVTAFIYADEEYQPYVAPLVELEDELVFESRSNYPMLLSRAVDESGGFAFVKEFVGRGPSYSNGCCRPNSDIDNCSLGGDGICQCPGWGFDDADCDEGVAASYRMAIDLAQKYPVLTRLSTRISPEEMIEDPIFRVAEPGEHAEARRLVLRGARFSLAACEAQVVDESRYREIELDQLCATTYCDFGECVVSDGRAGCRCDEGFVARSFVDVDDLRSITCVPEAPTVDFAAGGIDLPDACAGVEVQGGRCVDRGGFAAVACGADRAAFVGDGGTIECIVADHATSTSGARNYSKALEELDVCAPPPPTCPSDGWLRERNVQNPGLDCGDEPHASWFDVPPEPDCSESAADDDYAGDDVSMMDTRKPRPGIETPARSSSGCSIGFPAGSGPLAAFLILALGIARRNGRRTGVRW